MKKTFSIHIDAWSQGAPIPAKYAFGQPGSEGPFALSDNISPAIRWENAPEGTQCFALICSDPDVPSSAETVNQPGRTVPADLPRIQFFHWVLVHIPAKLTRLDAGAGSQSVVPRGKPSGSTPIGLHGINDYTAWFKGDADMEGNYGAYDGPCPPWNDSIVHHYHFELFALNTCALKLEQLFDGRQALQAMKGHVLAKACHTGTYSMNPNIG